MNLYFSVQEYHTRIYMKFKNIVITLIVTLGLILLGFYIYSSINYDKTKYEIDNYKIYTKNMGTCKQYFTVIIYEDENYKYETNYSVSKSDPYLYIRYRFKYISLTDAIDKDIISVKSLENIPKIKKINKS